MSEMVAAGWQARLRALTPARVALGRTGVSQQTRDLLDFQQAHAMARDAVHARIDVGGLARQIEEATGSPALRLHSRRLIGRRICSGRTSGACSMRRADAALSATRGESGCDLALVVADGLSALAVERHAPALLARALAAHR